MEIWINHVQINSLIYHCKDRKDARILTKVWIKWNFKLTVFELGGTDLYMQMMNHATANLRDVCLFNAAKLLFANGTLPTPIDCKFILQSTVVDKHFIEQFLHINSLEMALP